MSSRYLRPGALIGHVIVLAAALTCLRLGWWQWKVFEAAGGTGQNLGYSLLWPVFAGSFIYMWLRFLQLESERDESEASEDDEPSSETTAPEAPSVPEEDAIGRAEKRGRGRRHTSSATTHETYTVGVGYIDDDDDDPELAAYNRALAQLAEQDEIRGD